MTQSPTLASELLDLLVKTKKIVSLHQSLGIDEYPLSPDFKAFLAPGDTPVERSKKEQPKVSPAPPSPKVSLAEIREELGECTRCSLHEKRTALVFGMGNESAELMIIGDSPGTDDDLLGEPFRGEGGELLDKMLGAIGLKRADVYIATLVKCHQPENPAPDQEQINSCLNFLRRQIISVSPKIICTMGTLSAQTLLKSTKQLIHLRGRFHDFKDIPLMPTFHPEFLIRNPELKKAAWEDLKKIKKKYSETGR